MNIYHFIADFKYGGVELAAKSSIQELNYDDNFFLVCLGRVDSKLMNNLSDEEKNKIIELNLFKLSTPKKVSLFMNHLKENPPSIFIFSLWKASLIGFLLSLVYKETIFISFLHSTKFVHFFDKIFTRNAIKNFDYVFVDSTKTKEFALKFNKKVNIKVISFLLKAYKSKIKNLNQEKINFLYLGRISKHKRIDKSLDVIDHLLKKKLNVEFNIYGDDDGELKNITKKIEQLDLQNNVFINDAIKHEDLSKVFSENQFYLQLSDFEGFAMSVCEAMQNGLVCCVTPVGEIKNYSKDMSSAIHFKNNNLEDFVDKIFMVARNNDTFQSISIEGLKKWSNAIIYKDDLKNALNEIRLK